MKKVLLVIVTFLSVVIFGCAGNGRQAEHSGSEVGPEFCITIKENSCNFPTGMLIIENQEAERQRIWTAG